MRVACVQVALVDGDVKANRERVLRMTEQALWDRPDLVLLPELSTSGYCTDDYTRLAEPSDGPTVEALGTLAAASGASILVGLVILDSMGRPQNSSYLIGPTGVIGTYAKTHLCVNDAAAVDESTAFAPGQTLGLLDVSDVRLGVMICYDGHHGELPVTLVNQGAELLVWLNNRTLMTSWEPAAIALFNRVPVAAVNRVGTAAPQPVGEPPRIYSGVSSIVDHEGKMIAAAIADEEAVVVGEIDIEAGRVRRASHVLNTQQSRRSDLYTIN
jgi:predicted amidohydrolase